jgi:dTMP kinase
MLRTLRRAGHRLAIVTSKPEVNAKKIADRFGLTPFMDALVGPAPGEGHATKENLIRRAQSLLPGPYVMVGDRRFDVEGARKTGIASVGVTYGYGSREELKGSGADMIADTPMDVCRLLAPDAEWAPGWLITMEGVDGCGKTTQRRALEECLLERGYDLVHTREPGGDDIAERIRELILDPANTGMCDLTEAYLYAASRAQHVRSRLQPAIREGKMVLCDRFVDSSIAYQGGGRGLGAALVQSINAPAVDTCRPDLVIYLQMDPKEALSRRLGASAPDRLEQEDVAFFERTAAAYEQAFSGRQEVLRVNAGQEIGVVTAEMLSGVCRRLDEINGKDAAWQK